MAELTAAKIVETAVPAYIMAGHSTFTVLNTATGNRFTYRVDAPRTTGEGERVKLDETDVRFVSVLTNPDNVRGYDFLGMLFLDEGGTRPRYVHSTKKSKIGPDAASARVATWFFRHVFTGLPPSVEVWHAGRCGRCGRKLTVPSSIAIGLGPECANAGM